MTLPNFFLVGAAKTGATALHAALTSHPQLFSRGSRSPSTSSAADEPPPRRQQRWARGRRTPGRMVWRRAALRSALRAAPSGRSAASAPSSTSTTGVRRSASPGRPNARLIAVLRDPVDRAYSNWMHLRRAASSPRPTSCARSAAEVRPGGRRVGTLLALRAPGPLRRAVRHLYSPFPREQVLLLRYRDLRDEAAHAGPGLPLPRRLRGVATIAAPENVKPYVDPSALRYPAASPVAARGCGCRCVRRRSLAGREPSGLPHSTRRGLRAPSSRRSIGSKCSTGCATTLPCSRRSPASRSTTGGARRGGVSSARAGPRQSKPVVCERNSGVNTDPWPMTTLDFEKSVVVVEPPEPRPGSWAGAPSAVVADGAYWLAYRLRNPVGEGRGYANVIARSTDGVRFDTVPRYAVTPSAVTASSAPHWSSRRRAGGGCTSASRSRAPRRGGGPARGRDGRGTRGRAGPHGIAGDGVGGTEGPGRTPRPGRWLGAVGVGTPARRPRRDRPDGDLARREPGRGAVALGRDRARAAAGRVDAPGVRIATVIRDGARLLAYYDGRATAEENWAGQPASLSATATASSRRSATGLLTPRRTGPALSATSTSSPSRAGRGSGGILRGVARRRWP